MKKVETPEEKFKRIMKVTTEDVNKVAHEVLVFKNAKMGVIGPYKDAAEFLKAAQLPWIGAPKK